MERLLSEDCPACGRKMEKGYIFTGMRIWWNKEKPGLLTHEKEEALVESIWSGTRIEAYRCPDCKIVVFSYGNWNSG